MNGDVETAESKSDTSSFHKLKKALKQRARPLSQILLGFLLNSDFPFKNAWKLHLGPKLLLFLLLPPTPPLLASPLSLPLQLERRTVDRCQVSTSIDRIVDNRYVDHIFNILYGYHIFDILYIEHIFNNHSLSCTFIDFKQGTPHEWFDYYWFSLCRILPATSVSPFLPEI